MNLYIAEILSMQEREFKKCIMRDYLSFNRKYKDETGFPFLATSSKEYELQKFFEVRLEHYIRTLLINDVLSCLLENHGVGIYKSELLEMDQLGETFYTNSEYENKVGYEFVADYGNETIMYRYTDVKVEEAESLLSDFVDKIVVLDWAKTGKNEEERSIILSNGKELRYESLYELFNERIDIEAYQDFLSFLTAIVVEYQDFLGVKSVPKLSPFSLGKFRFEVENDFKQYINTIKDYMKADDKISAMDISENKGICYGYRIIDDENKNKKRYNKLEKNTKDMLHDSDILEVFEINKLYRYLIGGADFAKSFITSEYLYKQYDCSDCFDYTAIVSGYLKSIEQLLFQIASFSKNKGYKIKNNGEKNKNGVYPPSIKEGKVYKIDFIDENNGCFDTTIGSLTHFLNDNKTELILVDDIYKKVIIDCLDCYRVECRNDSFHLDNNYKWSRVDFIRWNTFLVYVFLLSCCKLGDTDLQTQNDFQMIRDDRLERLYDMIATGRDSVFEFVFMGDGCLLAPIKVKHIATESSYPSYDDIGRIKSVFLTFETITDHKKVIVMPGNIPEEMYFIDENGVKTKIE